MSGVELLRIRESQSVGLETVRMQKSVGSGDASSEATGRGKAIK
jgi:hypothetical protein